MGAARKVPGLFPKTLSSRIVVPLPIRLIPPRERELDAARLLRQQVDYGRRVRVRALDHERARDARERHAVRGPDHPTAVHDAIPERCAPGRRRRRRARVRRRPREIAALASERHERDAHQQAPAPLHRLLRARHAAFAALAAARGAPRFAERSRGGFAGPASSCTPAPYEARLNETLTGAGPTAARARRGRARRTDAQTTARRAGASGTDARTTARRARASGTDARTTANEASAFSSRPPVALADA